MNASASPLLTFLLPEIEGTGHAFSRFLAAATGALELRPLAGREDRLLRSALPIEVRALRPDAVIRMLDAPHLVLQRRPQEAMGIVEDFLRRAAARQAGQAPAVSRAVS